MTRRCRQPFALLLLLALVFRGLVPAGYMPGTQAGSGIMLQLCTAQGLKAVLVQEDEANHPGSPETHDGQACPFALSAVTGPVPAAPNFALLRTAETQPAFMPTATAAVLPCPRTQSPRGPPALA